jgi:phosphoribosyl 1,2-cyclic phosphodiesterase
MLYAGKSIKINFYGCGNFSFQNSDGLIMRRWVSVQINNGEFYSAVLNDNNYFFSHSHWDHIIAIAELDAFISVSRHWSVESVRQQMQVFVIRKNKLAFKILFGAFSRRKM